MKLETVKLSDQDQDVFIVATQIDDEIIRLDISDAYHDTSIEVTVDRKALLRWCESLMKNFKQ